VDHLGPRRFIAVGFAIVAAGAVLTLPAVLLTVPPEVTIVTWALTGVGMGFAYSAFTLVVLRRVPAVEQGAASSALQLSDILGTALGSGVGGAITAVGERSGGDGLGWGLGAVYVVAMVVSLAGLAATRRVGSDPAGRSGRAAAVD
jgi:MFS family permease